METIVSFLSPAAWKLVRQNNIIKKYLDSPQTISPNHMKFHMFRNSNDWKNSKGNHKKRHQALIYFALLHLTFPLTDSTTPALEHSISQKKICLQDCELIEKQVLYATYSSKFSIESTVITGFDTRVWTFCYRANLEFCLLR